MKIRIRLAPAAVFLVLMGIVLAGCGGMESPGTGGIGETGDLKASTKKPPGGDGTDSYWAKTYVGVVRPGYSQGPCIDAADNGYLVTGTYGATAVVRLDAAGGILWQRAYSGIDITSQSSVIQRTVDGGSVVAGGYNIPSSGAGGLFVMKLGADGSILWQKGYRDEAGPLASPLALRQTADGGFAVTTRTGMSQEFNLLRLSPDGTPVWQRTYYNPDNAVPYFRIYNGLEELADGSFVVNGWTNDLPEPARDASWVMKLSASGNVVWGKYYADVYNYAPWMQATPDGGYIIGGAIRPTMTAPEEAFAMKIDGRGNILWQKAIGSPGRDYFHSIRPTPDGGYFAVGDVDPAGNGLSYMWGVKMSGAGGVQWQKAYGVGAERGYAALTGVDGGYVAVGDTQSWGGAGGSIWIVKTLADGTCPPISVDTAFRAENSRVRARNMPVAFRTATPAAVDLSMEPTDISISVLQQAPAP